jgi:predicted nucleic acid-binding protein
MKLILDNNILFSLMKPDSVASEIFSLSATELIAPDFVESEFEGYKQECLRKSGLSKATFEKRWSFIKSNIAFMEVDLYSGFLGKALTLVPDPDDAPYIALGLATGLPLWSNDKLLSRQKEVIVLSTKELVSLLDL